MALSRSGAAKTSRRSAASSLRAERGTSPQAFLEKMYLAALPAGALEVFFDSFDDAGVVIGGDELNTG